MRMLILLGFLMMTVTAYAAEVSGESRFHLMTFKCEPETNDEVDSTPQSPPLVVDDPSTPGCNQWEINVVADGDLSRDQKNWKLPLLDINYGVGDNIQLKYELPYLRSQSDALSTSAVGESEVGLKYMFYEIEQSKTQFAFYPQVSFVSSSADAVNRGLVSPGKIVTLPLLMAARIGQTTLGDVNLTANLGYNISTKDDIANSMSAAVGVGMPLIHRLSIMGELSTEQALTKNSDDVREQDTRATIGMMGMVSKRFLLFGSLGHSLQASGSVEHLYTLAGFRILASGFSQ